MAETVIVLNQRSSAADLVENFYNSPTNGSGTRVTAFTATNNTTTGQSFIAYIYGPGDSTQEPVIPFTTVARDTANYGSAIVNQLIPAGGSLRLESSATDSINFYVTGVEVD